MPQTDAQKLRATIRRDTKRLAKLAVDIETVTARRLDAMKSAAQLGVTGEELAADSGLTPARVSQLVSLRKARAAAKAAAAPAAPQDGELWPLGDDELPDRYRPGTLGRMRELLADGVVTDRWAPRQAERPTIFMHVDTGEWWTPGAKHGHIPVWRAQSAAELLVGIPAEVERVYVVGHRPGVTPDGLHAHATEADAARAWYLADVPGWTSAGHYLADESAMVGRWTTTRPDGAPRVVEVQRAAVWFGDGDYSARDAAYAWAQLRRLVADRFSGGILMSTPATTGRDLWRRSLGKTARYPVLSDELRDLIQSTSGQGRRELLPGYGTVTTVTQWDMRLAYAALAWGMPVGAPTRVTGKGWGVLADDERQALAMRRGRWLVRATVPPGWALVGILPAPADGGRWVWPRRPGQTFTAWVSGPELRLALAHGWRVDVLEGMHWNEGKPLNTWKDELIAMTRAAQPQPGPVGAMLRAAIRAMILTTIGAFASRSHAVTRTASLDTPADALPADAPIREVGGMYVWEERGERSEWMIRSAHPEWSAEIWGRCRARLLDAPTADRTVRAGALHVRPGDVIGMRTDGLTLACEPTWADDGAPGRYRLEGRLTVREGVAWPQSEGELSAIKSSAARALEGAE